MSQSFEKFTPRRWGGRERDVRERKEIRKQPLRKE